MAISVKHKFTSLKGDGTDSTLLRPSNWNDEHNITLASGKLLGRMTAGSGLVEEIALTAIANSILSAADAATILSILGISPFTTGDVKITLKTAADSGWLMMDDGTFGSASSGASNRANADTQALFTLLYGFADADCPLLTSTGSATTRAAQGPSTTAFSTGCRMTLPRTLGRALVGAGAGSGLTSRAVGSSFGAESITLVRSDLPNQSITVSISDPGHSHSVGLAQNQSLSGFGIACASSGSSTTSSSFTGISASFNMNGNVTQTHPSTAQPSTALNIMVKL